MGLLMKIALNCLLFVGVVAISFIFNFLIPLLLFLIYRGMKQSYWTIFLMDFFLPCLFQYRILPSPVYAEAVWNRLVGWRPVVEITGYFIPITSDEARYFVIKLNCVCFTWICCPLVQTAWSFLRMKRCLSHLQKMLASKSDMIGNFSHF